jgi:uncharacterized phage protein gp47/JayE
VPLIRPDFSSINSQMYTDVVTGLNNAPVAKYSILGSLIRAFSRVADSIYSYCDSSYTNALPFTARGSSLAGWAAMWGCIRETPTSAFGSCTLTTNGAAVLPSNSIFIGSNGTSYTNPNILTASAAGTYTVPLVTTDTGSVTNLASGSAITLTATIANIVPAAVIITMIGGSDAETDAALFARAQEARSNPPSAANGGSYIGWALQCAGITRAWVQNTPAQPGTVIIYAMADGNATFGLSGTNGCATLDTRGTAATGQQLEIANFIYPLRSVTAFVQVVSPIAQPINLTITNTNPLTTASQAAVIAAVQARFLTIGTPLGMSVYESDISQAIQGVLVSFNLTSPTSATSIPLGSLPTLGSVVFS